MAVPKKRTTKSTKGQRRSHHRVSAQQLTICASCKKSTFSHRACMHCGSYRGLKVVKA